MKLRIVPVEFKKRNTIGDFLYMKDLPEYKNALFIFNDNVRDHPSAVTGGGNAQMRPFNQFGQCQPPKSAGIPTGLQGGFDDLNDDVQNHVDSAISEIRSLLKQFPYDQVIYSCTSNHSVSFEGKQVPLLGSSIFKVDPQVLEYITLQIWKLAK
eukprot:NODE_269_length_11261_cov_0.600359.p12 type:complete len:154 gc:universal NODE_269_length_11261_cov_0.600359:4776-5237(+)